MQISKKLREYFQTPSMPLEHLLLEVEALEDLLVVNESEIALLAQVAETHEQHIAKLEKQIKQERDISILYPPPTME